MRKVRYFGFVLVILGILIAAGTLVPQLFYFSILPSHELVGAGKTTAEIFSHWSLASAEVVPSPSQVPPETFKCSICYPNKPGSSACNERIYSWVARNLVLDQGPQNNLVFHFKNYFLGKALAYKYDISTVYLLYLAFAARPLQENDIEASCQKKFFKSCSNLSTEEALTLEIDIRMGKGERTSATEGLSAKIYSACVK